MSAVANSYAFVLFDLSQTDAALVFGPFFVVFLLIDVMVRLL